MPGFRQPKTKDLAEAKRHLAEAGYPNGLTVTALANVDSTILAKNRRVVAEQLRGVGINCTSCCCCFSFDSASPKS